MDLDSELSPPSAQEDEDSWPASPSLTMGNHRSKKNVLDALVHDEDSSSSRASPCLSLTSWERELRAEAGIQAAQYDELVERIPKIEITIEVPPVPSKGDYPKLTSMPSVVRVLEEFKENSALYFVVLMEDGAELEVPFNGLLNLHRGREALQQYQNFDDHGDTASDALDSYDSDIEMVETRRFRQPRKRDGFVPITDVFSSDDDELSRPGRKKYSSKTRRQLDNEATIQDFSDGQSDEDSEDSVSMFPREKRQKQRKTLSSLRSTRSTKNSNPLYNDYLDSEPDDDDKLPSRRGRSRAVQDGPLRRSGREKKQIGPMREIAEDEIPEVDTRASSNSVARISGVKEYFQTLTASSAFKLHHNTDCDVCGVEGHDAEKGTLIHCQGCTLSYHQNCLGARTSREHLVTKVGDRNFVLQCRRCVEFVRTKDRLAPRQGKCQGCGFPGQNCEPWRTRKTPREEQKERVDNGGQDPVAEVPRDFLNETKHVLFRCRGCYRAFHFCHLPAKVEAIISSDDDDTKAEKRFWEYFLNWLCYDCETAPGDVAGLVAWRPKDIESYEAGQSVEEVEEDSKEYLVKWHDKSYYQATWKPGPWVYGKTKASMRAAFARRDGGKNLPVMRAEDAIPEDYLRVDIVFDVQYNNIVNAQVQEVDFARISEVSRALVKYKGLTYEEAVWEKPPPSDDAERYKDFKLAYEDWVCGNWLRLPASSTLQKTINNLRNSNFEEKLVQKGQPKLLTGGELKEHQQDGMNWLLFKWHSKKNAILADEMGLGKTIQIVAFMSALQEAHVAPFLIVVPNATCANWKNEIKKWAPHLRVATFFGSAKARDMAQKYELFPKRGSTKENGLRCHVVITSYEAAQDESCLKILCKIYWAALIVDEGQRLKNDKSLLFNALKEADNLNKKCLRRAFSVLLTGTPMQNNARELFNLLNFLDKNLKPEDLETKYAGLGTEAVSADSVNELYDILRSFMLRRTKKILKELPPITQVILPVSMTSVQREIYRSIIEKNSEIIKALTGQRNKNIPKLHNVLMQQRKCLAHPYVYNIDIDPAASNATLSFRQLVEASGKLELLEIMLPKLQEEGHRVLIFSQFLNMLTIMEDFLVGLGINFCRLDGSQSNLEKQKRIDAFNAPDSDIFAFLLSTRAGGIGINLATADTVIILDPDFNPHQDIQAISRAHRIGQARKVLVFRLMTNVSAEEQIISKGKRKLALNRGLIEQIDKTDSDTGDLKSIILQGMGKILNDEVSNIHYGPDSVDKLLDRTKIEDTQTGESDEFESQFSVAKVWQNASGELHPTGPEDEPTDDSAWLPHLERLEAQKREAAKEAKRLESDKLGKGKRVRKTVNYSLPGDLSHRDDLPGNEHGLPLDDDARQAEDDLDFEAVASSSSEEENEDDVELPPVTDPAARRQSTSAANKSTKRPKVKKPRSVLPALLPPTYFCEACKFSLGLHPPGQCPMKLAGHETCKICGGAHFGTPGSCPFLKSEQKIGQMALDLRKSPETKDLREEALAVLRQAKTSVVQGNKRKREPILGVAASANATATNQSHQRLPPGPSSTTLGQFSRVSQPSPYLTQNQLQSQGSVHGVSQSAAGSSLQGNASVSQPSPYLPMSSNGLGSSSHVSQAQNINFRDYQVHPNPYGQPQTMVHGLTQTPLMYPFINHFQDQSRALNGMNDTNVAASLLSVQPHSTTLPDQRPERRDSNN